MDLQSSQNITHKYTDQDANHSIHTCKCSFSYFTLLYVTKQEISQTLIIQYDVGGCIICVRNKVGYLGKERRYKDSTKEVLFLF